MGLRDRAMDYGEKAADHAAGRADLPDGALMAFKSHIEGRNATVTVWPDRIEWTRHRMLGRDDTSTILTRSVTGIKTHKGGLQYTTVSIQSGASSVAMKVTKAQAAELRRIVGEYGQR